MQKTKFGKLLLVGVIWMAAASAWGQKADLGWKPERFDVGLTFNAERGQSATTTNNPSFWLKGAGTDVAVTSKNGLGMALAVNGGDSGNIATSGVGLSKITTLGGPYYSVPLWHSKGTQPKQVVRIFGEALFGRTHAFNTVVPTSSGTVSNINVFAMQLGAGLNVDLPKHFGWRVAQVDYVRSAIPNSFTDHQDDLRLSFGLNFHFGL